MGWFRGYHYFRLNTPLSSNQMVAFPTIAILVFAVIFFFLPEMVTRDTLSSCSTAMTTSRQTTSLPRSPRCAMGVQSTVATRSLRDSRTVGSIPVAALFTAAQSSPTVLPLNFSYLKGKSACKVKHDQISNVQILQVHLFLGKKMMSKQKTSLKIYTAPSSYTSAKPFWPHISSPMDAGMQGCTGHKMGGWEVSLVVFPADLKHAIPSTWITSRFPQFWVVMIFKK